MWKIGGCGKKRWQKTEESVLAVAFFVASKDPKEPSHSAALLTSLSRGHFASAPVTGLLIQKPVFPSRSRTDHSLSSVVKQLVVANAPLVAGIASLLALAFAFYLVRYILRQDAGNERVQELSRDIQAGAKTFMTREFRYLAVFAVVVAVVLYSMPETGLPTTVGFLVGTVASGLAGWIGMWIATKSNGRTAHAAQTSFAKALNIAYSGGSTMGFSVVGLGLLGLAVIYALFPEHSHAWLGYAFGSSCVALFLRVGGGIYTKSADVGADVVGKVEAGIPEDDPRNPGVIADNVGDNVGDVAGMGSDLYESYVSAVAATMFLGAEVDFAAAFPNLGFEDLGLMIAFLFGVLGIVSSIIGYFFVNAGEGTDVSYEQQAANARSALNRGTTVANVLTSLLALGLIFWLVPAGESAAAVIDDAAASMDVRWALFLTILSGLITGVVIGKATEYYTSEYAPVKQIAESAETGAATTIIEGLGTGMLSTVVPALAVSVATLLAYYLGGLFGIALAALGMLLTLGVVLSTDAYGPITDNAQGISEMANLGQDVRERCEALDSAGNTTAAIGKGFAIGSAALAALAWLATYFSEAAAQNLLSLEAGVNLMNPAVLVGLLLGAMLTFYLSSVGIHAISRGGAAVVNEVRRQFDEIDGVRSGDTKPDYARCVDITTGAALREMMLPGVVVLVAPVVVGALPGLGVEALAGLLAGVLMSGFLTAIFMSNAGGAWDNAKKYIESGVHGGKGSEAHKASVVGDTVGDPLKDTAGPSLNVLIKLMGKVAVIFLPLFAYLLG
nr:sodium-translocating pyrophosphatase [Salinibacter ruber]